MKRRRKFNYKGDKIIRAGFPALITNMTLKGESTMELG
jgi:hypothetical protein